MWEFEHGGQELRRPCWSAAEADSQMTGSSQVRFLDEVCLPFLQKTQNEDGGWGYRPGSLSWVEPTCWALMALVKAGRPADWEERVQRGAGWLLSARLPQGGWPVQPGQGEVYWTTALACLALHAQGNASAEVASGTRWLCDAWPADGGWLQRVHNWLFGASKVVRQNPFLHGWSWVPRTGSWVEPTCYGLILLRAIPGEALPPNAARRRRSAEAMLYDRVCPGGGWNSGNPLVYGVAGEPRIGPTVWALLALQAYAGRAANQESVKWLESVYGSIEGPSSLALAQICLEAYGRPVPAGEADIARLHGNNEFLDNLLTAAWTVLALCPGRDWLRWSANGEAAGE